MPLMSGRATLTAQLWTADGGYLEATTGVRIGGAEAVLEYALPRSETYYLDQRESWMVDCGVSGKSEVVLSIFADADRTEHVVSVRKSIANQGMFSIPWKGETAEGRVEPHLLVQRLPQGAGRPCLYVPAVCGGGSSRQRKPFT